MAAGLDPRAGRDELRRDIAALVACAVSVYGWLTGFGLLLASRDQGVIALLAIAVASAAVPFWLRALRS